MSNEITKTAVPKLRFPEFQGAGEWVEERICEIGEVIPGYGFPESYQGKITGEYPFYKVSDISNAILKGSHFIEVAANYIDVRELKLIKAKTIPAGTTVFAKIGEAIRSNRRAITTCESVIDNNVAGVKGLPGKAHYLFVFYTLCQVDLIEYAGGAVPSVSKSTLENILIFTTSYREQEKIAACLSSLDDLLTAQNAKLAALQAHKRGLMQGLFPAEGETVPKLRFPEFQEAGEWQGYLLKDVFAIFQGFAFSSSVSTSEGIRWLKIADVGIQRMSLDAPSFLPANYKETHKKYLVLEGDYVMALTRPILGDELKIALVDKDFDGALLNQRVGKLVTPNNITFVYYLLQTAKLISNIKKSIAGSEPPNLSTYQIEDIETLIPSKAEQQKIADCLSSLDNRITAQSQKIEALKLHKKGLMQNLFPAAAEPTL